MRAIVMTAYGGPEVVELRSWPEPVVGEREVLIEVYAAGVNPVDVKIRKGLMKPLLKYSLPVIMGNDLAGKVVAVGRAVTRLRPGDAVYATVSKARLGAFAEYAALDERDVAVKPMGLTFGEAASLPLVALTVYEAFVDIAKVTPGQRVFVKAGSGGVGTFAIQLAKALGAEVATTTSAANVEWVRGLGADHVIDYGKERFEARLRGYDVALDSVDGDDPARAFSILNPGGHLVAVAGPPDAKFAKAYGLGPISQWACRWLSRKETRLAQATGVHYSFLFVRPSGARLAEIGERVERRQIRPVVDRVFPFEQAREALAYVERGRSRGKVVLQLKPEPGE
jgi:NADPH:quinone reductase-like Zn-dependent oxidoreductase